MKKTFFLFLVFIVGYSCETHRTLRQARKYAHNVDTTKTDIYNFKIIKSPFKMKIIDFMGSDVGCGVVISYSSCIGVNGNNDMIKVITECPEFYGGYSFSVGQTVEVFPDTTKNKVSFTLNTKLQFNKTTPQYETSLQDKKYTTTYGLLSVVVE